MTSFFTALAPVRDFTDIADRRHYVACPGDWHLVLTDIQGSTQAIESGRYRDVNLMGAAAIVAAQNALGSREVPFAFGGDGATILIPADGVEAVRQALLRLKAHSEARFSLKMRVGIVPVALLERHGTPVLVAKYEIAAGNYLAMFQGGGTQLAEKWIKSSGPDGQSFCLVAGESEPAPNLDNLSCRWSPLPAKNGVIASILVLARETAQAGGVYRDVIRAIDPILQAETFRPVSQGAMKSRSVRDVLAVELRLATHKGFLKALVSALIEITYMRISLLMRRNLAAPDVLSYLRDTPTNSDYKKFDDMLRMVIDCSEEQYRRVLEVLEREHLDGRVFFGVHRAKSALMTCVVHKLDSNQHVHFIDGNDGGYALAAKMLKAQISGVAGRVSSAQTI